MRFRLTDRLLRGFFEILAHLTIITLLIFAATRPVGAQTKEALGMEQKEATSAMEQSTRSAEKEATGGAISKYTLPYAGLLPDHPLYFLKTLRDRIIDLLIADNLKKADFTLLQADKHLSMAIVLVEQGKPELAESTESKGQNYLLRTLTHREKAKVEGKDTTGLSTKLAASLDKHHEVLLDLAKKTEGSVKDRFVTMASDTTHMRKNLQK